MVEIMPSRKKSSRSNRSSRKKNSRTRKSHPKSRACGRNLKYVGYAENNHWFKLAGKPAHEKSAYGYETKGGKCVTVSKTQYLLSLKHHHQKKQARKKSR